MSDYTPTTVGSRYVGQAQERRKAFDRWLADHDRKLRNETLEEVIEQNRDLLDCSGDTRWVSRVRAMKAATPTEPHAKETQP